MTTLAHAFNAAGPMAWLLWLGVAVLLAGAARLAGVAKHRIPERAGIAAIIVGLVLAVLGNSHEETPDSASRPVTQGSVRILDPGDGASVPGGETLVEVEVTDFVLVPSMADSARSGYGHLHIAVDGVDVSMPEALPSEGIPVCLVEGNHTITAGLVAEDHSGFRNESEVTDTVRVRAGPGDC